MIRRSRINVRPNVKPSARVPASSRDAPQVNPQAAQAPTDLAHDAGVKAGGGEEQEARPTPSAPAVESNNNTDTQSHAVQPQAESISPAGDAAAQSTATSSIPTSGPQRRKRFTVLPNLAKPRTSAAPASTRTSSRTPKSPVKASVTSPEPEPTAPDPSPQGQPASEGRGKRRPSGGGRQSKAQPKTGPALQASLQPSADPPEQDHGELEKNEPSAANQNPSEEIQSEPAATTEIPAQSHELQLAQSETETAMEEQGDGVSSEKSLSNPQKEEAQSQSQSTAHVPLALRTMNDPTDRMRLAKARKLRELLKKEMNKDKKEKNQRPKMAIKTCKTAKDHTKMTMRELIYYLPSTNPMKSYVEDEQKAAETVSPPSPKSPPPAPPAVPAVQVEECAEEEEEMPGSATGEEEPLLAPRVKVAADGSLIIDEESLTVEVLRVKGPNPAEDRDPIFERGSTTTYSSFRKGTYTKPWSSKETDMFFLAISMVGTDFSMIGQLFPHRARIEIKNKFKKEERANSWRIDKAFKERRRLDLDFFNNLLEKILREEEKKRKKKKDGAKLPQKVSGTPRRKSAARSKRVSSSAGSEEESSGSDVMEGEKENEGFSNDGGSTTTPISPQRKSAKKNKQIKRAADAAVPEDAENSTAEGQAPDDRLPKPDLDLENSASSEIKPAQLKGRARRAAPNLLRRWRNPALQKKTQDTSAEEESGKIKDSKVLPSSAPEKDKRSTSDVVLGVSEDSEEEEPDLTAVQEHILNKPTRSGRIPKLSQHVIRAVADEDEEEVEQQLPSGPPSEARGPNVSARRPRKKPGPSLKRGMPRRGKSRLVTLRASAAEEEDDDEEENYNVTQGEEQYLSNAEEEENQAFVPMGLRAQPVVRTEVEETMEELDMCVNVPDVLGLPQNAVCPESSCARSLGPGGSVPCEHQLDLLVDVIEFLAPEHMEVSEESYTEAARTLLTIGHSAQMIPAVETHSADEDVIIIEEQSRFAQQDVQQEVVLETTDHVEAGDETFQVVTSDLSASVIPDCKDSVAEASQQDLGPVEESVSSKKTDSEASNIKTSEQTAPQTRRNRLPKPKPNLGRASRPLKAQQKPTSPEKDTSSPTEPVKASAEGQMEESKLLMEASEESKRALEDSGKVSSHSPAVASRPEPSERNSNPCEQKGSVKGEEKSSQLLLEKKQEREGSEVKVCVEEKNMEAREERLQLQTHSESGSSVFESPVQPPQPIRRFRGPKPKPNLVRSPRTTHTETQKKPAQPTAVRSEKSSISPNQMQQETPCDSETAVRSDGPAELSGAVGKLDSSEMAGKKSGSVIVDVAESVSAEPPGTTAEVISADWDPSSDEPVFILSLTEVPSTPSEKEELPAKSESLSEPPRAAAADVGDSGPAGDQASHLILSDMLAPAIDVDESEEVKELSRESDNKGHKEEALSRINKRDYSLLNQKNPVEEGPAEQHGQRSLSCEDDESEETNHLAKRRKLPEKGRRAKLQVKPNPVQRKSLRGLPAKEGASSAPASSQQTFSTSEETALSATPVTDIPPTSVSPVKRTKASSTAPKDATLLPAPPQSSSEQISVPSPRPVSIEAPPTHTVPQASSQDIVGQEELPERKAVESDGVEDSEPSGSGVESHPVHQITPLATTGPLTRPGRRPRGFLSFMSSTSTQGSSSASRGSSAGPQKPAINASRSERRRPAPGPLASASRPASASQKLSRLDPSPASTLSPSVSSTPAPEVNTEPGTSGTNPNTEEEPTSVSAYFFSDIFTMVDEQEEME
ncbi:uncharacterized protein [Salminus brasiliensis]|uniref:uncharacterized protein isoform X2 n=1 Tax=Salminus brasiliensis TaxID=930266 RepID=UPI003B832A56